MTYATVCSGIEAPSLAWGPLGWTPLWFSEIGPFPSAVLAERYPGVPNHGDFTRLLRDRPATPDVLCGGTPCQSFSIAGLRGGLSDPRGNLALAYVALAGALRPRWVVWENVPGVLSIDDGDAFRSLLRGLVEVGYGVAYRVLDAQWFGLAQRRERVFVVGCLGADWRRAGAVLFEPEGVRWDSPPRREAGARAAAGVEGGAGVAGAIGGTGVGAGHRLGVDEVAGGQVVGTLCSNRKAAGSATSRDAENGMVIPVDLQNTRSGRGSPLVYDDPRRFDAKGVHRGGDGSPTHPPLNTVPGQQVPYVQESNQGATGLRRLTPLEWERLQGMPDHYTRVPFRKRLAADGPRYRAIGNSMAVTVVRWIGRRIALVDAIPVETAAPLAESVRDLACGSGRAG